MNCRHLFTLPGILEVVALVLCTLSAIVGTTAFVTSTYNKSCGDGTAENYITPTQSTETTPVITTLRTRPTSLPVSSSSPPLKFYRDITTTEISEYKDMAPVLWMERFQISVSWIAIIVSAFLLILYIILKDVEYSKIFKAVKFGFHFVFMILLVVSAIFMAYAAVEIDRQICQHNFDKREDCQKYMQKMSAAVLAFLTAILYGTICVKLVSSKLYEEV